MNGYRCSNETIVTIVGTTFRFEVVQCFFWRINLMFEAYWMGKWAQQLSIIFMACMRIWTVAKTILHKTACFKIVNIYAWRVINAYQLSWTDSYYKIFFSSNTISIFRTSSYQQDSAWAWFVPERLWCWVWVSSWFFDLHTRTTPEIQGYWECHCPLQPGRSHAH